MAIAVKLNATAGMYDNSGKVNCYYQRGRSLDVQMSYKQFVVFSRSFCIYVGTNWHTNNRVVLKQR